MKKRIFSVLTALALALSLIPSAFADTGIVDASKGYDTVGENQYAYPTQTNYDPFTTTNAVEASKYYTWYKDLGNGSWTWDSSLHPQDENPRDGVYDYLSGKACGTYGHYVLYEDMVFSKAPTYFLMNASTDTSVLGDVGIQVSVISDNGTETVLADVAIPKNGWTAFQTGTYAKIETEIEPGTYDVKLKFTNDGNLKSFVFGADLKNAYSKINALDYDSKHEGVEENQAENCLGNAAYNNWVSFDAVDFGKTGAAYLKFYTTMVGAETVNRKFKITNGHGGEVLQDWMNIPGKNGDWSEKVAIFPLDSTKFKGIKNICIQYEHTSGKDNLFGIEFVEMKDANVLQAAHTGDYVGNEYQMNFGIGGYNKIVFEGLQKGEGEANIKILSSDGTTEVETIAIQDGKSEYYLSNIKDYTNVKTIKLSADDGVSFTGFKFNAEYDAFPNKTEVKTAYVGVDAQKAEEVASASSDGLAKGQKAVTNTFIDLTGATAFGLIEKEYQLKKAGYDVVFVEAGANCESVVNALTGTNSYVIVVGESDVSAKYGIVSTTLETIADDLNHETSYKTAVANYLNPYTEIIAMDSCGEGTDAPVSDNVALNMTGKRAVFRNLNFAQGAASINVKAGLGSSYSGKMSVYLDSVSDANKLGEFDINAQGWTSWQNHIVNLNKTIYGVHDIWFTASANGNLYSLSFEQSQNVNVSETLTPDMATATVLNQKAYVDETNTMQYTVDFGENAKSYNLWAEVAGAQAGTLTFTIDNQTLTAPISADGAFAKTYSAEHISLSGVKTVSVSSDVACAVGNAKFLGAVSIDDDVLGVSNYSESNANVSETRFGGFNDGTQYVKWTNVDFGNTEALRKVTFTYGTTKDYQNTVMTLRLDAIDGPVIAKADAKYADGIGWEAPVTTTVSAIKGVTGVHTVYLTVEEGEYTETERGQGGGHTLAANIFGVDFEKVSDTYFVSHDEAILYNKQTSEYEKKASNAVLTFIGAEDVSNVIFAEAIYNAQNKLIDIDISNHTVAAGELNAISLSVKYQDLPAGEYTVKGFVWNGQTFAPINGEAVTFTTFTVK